MRAEKFNLPIHSWMKIEMFSWQYFCRKQWKLKLSICSWQGIGSRIFPFLVDDGLCLWLSELQEGVLLTYITVYTPSLYRQLRLHGALQMPLSYIISYRQIISYHHIMSYKGQSIQLFKINYSPQVCFIVQHNLDVTK